jgi:uncharacterized membrane protein
VPELPPPLPPAERTVVQLVAETIRAYGAQFWRVLPLGAPVAVATQISLGRSGDLDTVVLLALAPGFALAFVVACRLVVGGRITPLACGLALVVFLPVPILERAYVLPALAWLAIFGLSVPAAMVEQLGFRDALARGRRLAAADYVHALGSLCTLAILVFLSERTLIVLLRTQSENSARVAYLLADLVLSPLLYLGGAMLYVDQAARTESPLGVGDPV